MINEEFMDAAKVHIKILIHEHAELRWSHQPQVQHLVPDLGQQCAPAPAGCTLVTASPPSPSHAVGLEVPMDHGQVTAGGSELQRLLPPLPAPAVLTSTLQTTRTARGFLSVQ